MQRRTEQIRLFPYVYVSAGNTATYANICTNSSFDTQIKIHTAPGRRASRKIYKLEIVVLSIINIYQSTYGVIRTHTQHTRSLAHPVHKVIIHVMMVAPHATSRRVQYTNALLFTLNWSGFDFIRANLLDAAIITINKRSDWRNGCARIFRMRYAEVSYFTFGPFV